MENTVIVDKTLIPSLRSCRTRTELHHFFSSNNISDPATKSLYLRAATNEIAAFYSSGKEIPVDIRYLDDEVLFLKGTWRAFQNNEA